MGPAARLAASGAFAALTAWTAPATQAPAVEVAARALQPGEIIAITVTPTRPAAAMHVRAFDRDWSAFAAADGSWRAYVGIDLDVAPGDHAVSGRLDGPAGTDRWTRTVAVMAREFRTRTLKVDEAFVDPPASALARIADEAAELDRIWRSSADRPLWTGPFQRPVAQEANSAFGSRSVFNGQSRSPHGGADFASPAGTPVRAPGGGRVRLARDLYFSGGTVIVDHGAGLMSLFAHLSAIDVAAGATVSAGDILGKTGATGRVTGPHLHWAVRVHGARVDPLSVVHLLNLPARPHSVSSNGGSIAKNSPRMNSDGGIPNIW